MFGKDLKRFKDKAMTDVLAVRNASAFDLFSAIVMGTPVDKGVLRNNWFLQMNTYSNEITEIADKSGGGTTARAKGELDTGALKEDVCFVNNLPYAIPIEFDGLSGKAKQGMVRINTARWDTIVAMNVRRLAK